MKPRYPDLPESGGRSSAASRALRGIYGAEQEVIFLQTHKLGTPGLSDFTEMSDLGVSVADVSIDHRLYHFRLIVGASNMPT
jgi:hypothetical protein